MIDKKWTLFLDRDGVLNEDQVPWYVLDKKDFVLYEGVKEAMAQFAGQFGLIVICTNQRCIGRGLLSEEGLAEIHEYLRSLLAPTGGRIDHFYFAGAEDRTDPIRKPYSGMALKALADYPQIDLEKSIMVGNNPTDMEFAINSGIKHQVFLTTTIKELDFLDPTKQWHFENLKNFADSISDGELPTHA